MSWPATLLVELTAELTLFASAAYLLLGAEDFIHDLCFFGRAAWRELTVYSVTARATAPGLVGGRTSGWMALFVPAWKEAAVIETMLRTTLERVDHDDYRIFVGFYRNDPATREAIDRVEDPRVVKVEVDADGPTSKADCLNRLHGALVGYELAIDRRAKAVILHDAEDVVHSLELRLFDRFVEHAGAVQLPVVPLLDRSSPWVAGHYADEFAEAHGKNLVVREAIGAAIPLAGVGCAIERAALARLAARRDGQPFMTDSMTEDYELGLRLGAMGVRTMFVRLPARPDGSGLVATRSHFPATVAEAVRQKGRWIGGIAFAGWDRLGWHGAAGERWMRLRDRRAPFATFVMLVGYLVALLWAQVALAMALGAPVSVRFSPMLGWMLGLNAFFLGWRLAMRAGFTARQYGLVEGIRAIPRTLVSNWVAILAVRKAYAEHEAGGPRRWDKTDHHFPAEIPDE